MTQIFSYSAKTLAGDNSQITVCSGPVIVSQDKKVLLHISDSTGKYQFIGGRLDTKLSLIENVLERAGEVMNSENIIISEEEPLCIHGNIEREEKAEYLVLFHFGATLKDESDTGTGVWKTLEEIYELEKQDMLSSKNVVMASEYFLGR